MSFLDNLENNLKALEGREEKDPEAVRRNQQRREMERSEALRRAPFVEALKKSAFTSDLLTHCRTIGHGQRVLVRFTWLGDNLRLDAGGRRMELIPTPEGIDAVMSMDGAETGRIKIDTQADDAGTLARNWLTSASR